VDITRKLFSKIEQNKNANKQFKQGGDSQRLAPQLPNPQKKGGYCC
jgi:hypothetical protein